jgi:ribose transport system ATP-binding protein
MAEVPAMRLRGASKRFRGVHALEDVDLDIAQGEVHALLGQNGSGKSTLIKILGGVHAPEHGETLELWGKPVSLPIGAAREHGIAVIHQDLGLAEQMSVWENLGITSGYDVPSLLPIRRGQERRRCRALLDSLGVEVDLDAIVADLSPATRAGVALARARRVLEDHSERHLFVLDEPTTHLSAGEAQRVVDLMRAVARSGSSVLFISHRLPEVLDVADRITVLRDGTVAAAIDGAVANPESIVAAMLGRRLQQFYPDPASATSSEVVLDVRDLIGGRLRGVSFALRKGEILGFAGVAGSGHEEIPYLLAGGRRAEGGSASFGDVELVGMEPRELLAHGVILAPGNRQRDGAWVSASARENITLPTLRRYRRWNGVVRSDERRTSRELMVRLTVQPPEPERTFDEFSGGNQQKIVLAKCVSMDPRIFVLDEPTQGVDAGAKRDVLELLVEAADRGAGVVLVSGDYEQLANVANRVLIIRDGVIAGELNGERLTEQAIAELAHGGVVQP